ncbi:Outer membrane receptor for ferrienterochelin and colicins [Marivirga sericea]|uniref:Outer membrane receptor for ferrienterochelin and colicins n=2 Tax=Marivirga sericea TaxID=1028 RepID=A0A1X7IPF1_9BACT|nr:Outer membrane receptor for ferrienterochelin and colicins [Marivirga sericea]
MPSFAQESSHLSLRSVFEIIENSYEVRFTYLDQTIDNFTLEAPPKNFSLSQTLDYLKKKTNLSYVLLEDGYISVRLPKPSSTICGFLVDEESKSPISDALIYRAEQRTTTDQNGYFELENGLEQESIYARHINYGTRKIAAENAAGECATIFLSASIINLEEIVIQNYITKGISKQKNGTIKIDVQNTEILPGLTEADVLFSLQNLPGIQSSKENVTDINIRGGTNDQNLILWDGVRMYQTGHFFGLISAMNPHIVDQASLTKNGTSASLGEGVSGTIQVETKKATPKDLQMELGSNLINSDLVLQSPLGKKSSLLLASRQSLNGLFTTPTYSQYFDRAFRGTDVINETTASPVVNSDERFRFYDLAFKIQHEFSAADKLQVGFLAVGNSLEYQENITTDSSQIARISNLDQNSILGHIKYQRLWSDKFKTTFFASVSDYTQQSINYDVLNDQEHVLDNEILETALKVDGTYFISNQLDLTAGIQIQETGILNFRDINTPDFTLLSKEVLQTSSFFLEANSSPFSGSHLNLGLRANYFGKFDRLRVEPRLSFLQEIGRHLSVEVQGEMKSQTTVQVIDFQTDFLGVENRKWELVNEEDIPLLTSSQLSLGLNYQRDHLLLTVEGFTKQVDGVITSSQGFLNQFQYERAPGSYTAHGLEFLINPRFGRFNSWATYSYLNSDYSFSDLIPPVFRNNFDITHNLSLGLSYKVDRLELSSGLNFRSGLPFTNALDFDQNQQEIIYDSPNTGTLAPYFRLDFSAKYHFDISAKLRADVGLALWNLTNRDNVIASFYQYADEEIRRNNQTALGLTPNLTLRLYYNKNS